MLQWLNSQRNKSNSHLKVVTTKQPLYWLTNPLSCLPMNLPVWSYRNTHIFLSISDFIMMIPTHTKCVHELSQSDLYDAPISRAMVRRLARRGFWYPLITSTTPSSSCPNGFPSSLGFFTTGASFLFGFTLCCSTQTKHWDITGLWWIHKHQCYLYFYSAWQQSNSWYKGTPSHIHG